MACARVTSGRRGREQEGERKREKERERDRGQAQSPESLFKIYFKGRTKADKLYTDAGKGKETENKPPEGARCRLGGRGRGLGEAQMFSWGLFT